MDIGFDYASNFADVQRTLEDRYTTQNQLGESRFGRVYRARRMEWKDVVINCLQDDDWCVSCTNLAGENVGIFQVPDGEKPFDAWVAHELITSMNQAQEQLRLIDPTGSIFCTQKLCPEFVAIKYVVIDDEDGVSPQSIREITIQKDLEHENVVRLHEVFCLQRNLALVFELMERNLRQHMRARKNHLSQEEVNCFMKQLMAGMEFLHARGIMHRDVKPQNLFIDSNGLLKIGDFELARTVTSLLHASTHDVITLWYRPLEILLGGKIYGFPVDMWSCGCCFAEMASGYPLFPGDSQIGTIFCIFQKLGTPAKQHWDGLNELPHFKPSFPNWARKRWSEIWYPSTPLGHEGLELLDGLLQYDPAKRISASAALNFQYFAKGA